MAAESSRSSSSADSYIGSLISLTSKSEMRYEGVLNIINTDESSIGLRNVRSFGTEGRKKDGPQVPPSDKVYEYILFRGSDIKDLQVKSSPPVQTSPPLNSDPAIIQSHYPVPASTSQSLPLGDISSHTAQVGHPGASFQGGLPLYQPGGNIGSWGPSPPPLTANSGGLAMPMYWQGFYGPPSGLPQLHQQSLLRGPPGLSMPPSMQQPMQYPGFNASLPTGASSLPVSNLPDYPFPLVPGTTSSHDPASMGFPASTLPSMLPPAPSSGLTPETTLPSFIPNKAFNPTLPAATLSATLPVPSPLPTSSPATSAAVPSVSNKASVLSGPSLAYPTVSQTTSSVVGTSSSSQIETPPPLLVTPGQLLQPGPAAVSSSQPSQTVHKDVEVVQVSSSAAEPPAAVVAKAQPPILPLPQPSHSGQKLNGASFQSRNSYNGYRGRERGRGTGSSRPVAKFTEDFDFMAMNEKFNKDEVWGHLGKSNNTKEKEGNGEGTDEDDYEDEDDTELAKIDTKPIYNKDDFFDSLSSNALDNESNRGRTRFSEQMKIDTETFGDFSRYRGGRGGRGPFRGGGRFRGGGYYGRGYGHYGGRGRGRGMSSLSPFLLVGIGSSTAALLAAITHFSLSRRGIAVKFSSPLTALHGVIRLSAPDKDVESKSTDYNASPADVVVPESNMESSNEANHIKRQEGKLGRIIVPVAMDSTQQEALLMLRKLKIIEDDFRADELCTRREYARWLVRANSLLERNPKHQITPSVALSGSIFGAFDDVSMEDPDFGSIQSLAEAGIILSKLSGKNSSSDPDDSQGHEGVYFFPERFLSRQDLIDWKAQLEYETVPGIEEKISKTNMGFMDLREISSDASTGLLVDMLAGDNSILRKVFGQGKRFQPNKPSTKSQAAVALTTGRMNKAIHAELSRLVAENISKQNEMVEIRSDLLARGDIQRYWDGRLEEERSRAIEVERAYLSAIQNLEQEKIVQVNTLAQHLKEKATIDCQKQLLSSLKEEVNEMRERLAADKAQHEDEQCNLKDLLSHSQAKLDGILDTKSILEAEIESLRILRSWLEDEARKSQARAKVLEEVRRRWKWVDQP